MNKFTAEEVRAQVDAYADSPVARKMLRAYADRIEADERAVTDEVARKAYAALETEGDAIECMRNALLAVWPSVPAQPVWPDELQERGFDDAGDVLNYLDAIAHEVHRITGDEGEDTELAVLRRVPEQPEPANPREQGIIPALLTEGPDCIKPELRESYRAGWNGARTWVRNALARSEPSSANAEDAERYRWWRDNPEHPSVPYFEDGRWHIPYETSNARGFGGGVGAMSFDTLDDAIDAARATKGSAS